MISSMTNYTVVESDIDYFGHAESGTHVRMFRKGIEALMIEHLGDGFIGLLEKRRIAFPLVRTEIDYRADILLGDEIDIYTGVESIGETSMTYRQSFTRNGETVSELKHVAVCHDFSGGKPKKSRVPDWVREKLLQNDDA